MKKVIYLIAIPFGILFASCDYVANPYPEINANVGDTSTCPTPSFPVVTNHIKKIMIEDFTGHVCGNCPLGAVQLHNIDSIYPGRIVGVAEHVDSYFAAPHPGYGGTTVPAFMDDFRTVVGNTYNDFFRASATGLPIGMIGRKNYSPSGIPHLKNYQNWATYVAGIINEPSEVDLQMEISYDASTRALCCFVRDSFLTNRNDSLRLTVLLLQDSIVGYQDYLGVAMSDYVFNHVLRDVVTPTGAWGELISFGSNPAGTKHINKFAYNIAAGYKSPVANSVEIPCVVAHCHLVAFIYKTSNYEIIQSEEVKITP